MYSEAVKQQADERRRAERKQRHLQDDLRYALRKLQDPIDLSLSFEEVSISGPCLIYVQTNQPCLGCAFDARSS